MFVCTGNQLEELPQESGAEVFERFKVDSMGLCNLVSLTKLDASTNKLTSLPKDFGVLTEMKALKLSKNNIAEIDGEWMYKL